MNNVVLDLSVLLTFLPITYGQSICFFLMLSSQKNIMNPVKITNRNGKVMFSEAPVCSQGLGYFWSHVLSGR